MTWVAVGTAAAIGAGTGAVSAAAQGKEGDDILKSALLGGTVGAVTGGVGAAAAPGATEVGVGLGEALTEEGIKAASEQTMTDALANEALTPLTEIGSGINPVPAGLEQIAPTGATPLPATGDFSQAELNAVNQGLAEGNASGASPYAPTASVSETPLVPANAAPPTTPSPGNASWSEGFSPEPPVREVGQGIPLQTPAEAAYNAPFEPAPMPKPEASNPFLQGAKDVGEWMDKNPFKTGAAAYIGLQATGVLNPKSAQMPQEKKTFKNQYSLSPNFRGGPYSEPNVYRPSYAAGGITQINGPVERMSANALGGTANMFPQSQQERTNFATPTQMPASAEVTMNNQYQGVTMASGGQVKGYADGGMPSLFSDPKAYFASKGMSTYTGTQAEEQAAMAANQAAGIKTMANFAAPQQDMMGLSSLDTGGLSSMISQPTGQSTYPSATAMQGGFGQGAQGYPSFSSGSGGGAGGGGGPFPLEGQYGIIKMANGGIARFSEGEEVEGRPSRRYRGDLMGTLDKYNEMIEGRRSGSLPSGKSDPYTGEIGIVTDSDADTRLQDAYTASLTRLKKGNKRANVGIASLPAGVQAGALSMPTQNAAGGGIMQANLGSYAAGGNPRLLRGPGDGMSDNIPATIGGKQPARLADGEFVVPADVVSHLGNGSTNAGAKKLHGMMDKVRMDRTGKKKQAPAVKAGKYIPK